MTESLDPRLTPARPHVADLRLRDRVAAARYVAGTPRRVTAPSAPLRRAPAADAGLDTEALLGDAVDLYDAADGYAFVQLARDGYVGYLPADSLGPVDPEPTHRVTALRTFLYPEPDLKRPVLGHLSLGARLAATGEAGAYLETPGGYVFARHCAPVDARAPDYAATAARLAGTPYLWGGRTSLGLDCSGLVQLCLDAAGLPCPRDADMQERALGQALPFDPARPDFAGLRRGDFVFWRGHVGLMGDPETLIHANGHHMAVAAEPLAEAVARIAAHSFGAVTGIRRL
ncbi:cell wall-associated NlpC family hydrolase [Methylobacterium sp. PvP062]|uniref:Cell wall-associated NlpC family hydrolase n=1 Tax=Methylobacterium radiotolerans TaxID=31998 RepID=A0ABV2NHC3_9HYPH|nr:MULTISPECIES: NlpC/P60 family protein [Methylobacterium]MCX7330822.1 NlpC/P60 family protein [Hyphomicrobiales bacterium]KZB99051.1 Gamma-D-glutamyl-L-lysine endopeptidase [Methylobacterium radiotolerans]MBP2497421.1 cell wall-associated NlpC family hydrolase [Methylobacterium sp. PvP105]MBP2502708.1 cell wall-associated NlpC family hydrolase [Methylobacterium sp. PvP109]ONF48110.1 peptidase P60 [Methylobacterium radiotolerans]